MTGIPPYLKGFLSFALAAQHLNLLTGCPHVTLQALGEHEGFELSYLLLRPETPPEIGRLSEHRILHRRQLHLQSNQSTHAYLQNSPICMETPAHGEVVRWDLKS